MIRSGDPFQGIVSPGSKNPGHPSWATHCGCEWLLNNEGRHGGGRYVFIQFLERSPYSSPHHPPLIPPLIRRDIPLWASMWPARLTTTRHPLSR